MASGPSDKALQRAVALNPGDHAAAVLQAAHDSALGLDRSVCLRDVFESLHRWEHSDPDYVDNDVRSWLEEDLK